jgi:large subunit ribosomal protein L13
LPDEKPPTGKPKSAKTTGSSGPRPKPSAPAESRRPAPVPPGARLGANVVDVSGLVLGRAASLLAKRLLSGEHIVVINAEKAVVTGSRENVLEFYRANRARGSVRSGPHFPRYPDRIFRRTVRGMLPHLKTRGKEALDRLEVHIGRPSELGDAPSSSLDGAKARAALRPPMTLEEISRLLGARL